MAGNSFGNVFKLTTFGESHGPAIGGVIDGCPAGLKIDLDFIQNELDRRKPGQSAITTDRKETDRIEFLSGIFEGVTLGTPIAFLILNEDHHSSDYDALKSVYRPGHADEVWDKKFGRRDHRGGGRSSARETAARVAAGAIAKLIIHSKGIRVQAYVSSVKDIEVMSDYTNLDLEKIDTNVIRCPEEATAKKMIALVEEMKATGDSVGGTITCVCKSIPAGLGSPVFDKFHAVMSHAMLSINAAKAFEMQDGFASTKRLGSENNPLPSGVAGGITNGKDVVFKVGFKPVSTISLPQDAMNVSGEKVLLEATGRHDPCVLPRAVPIVEAMASMVIADFLLQSRIDKL